MAEKGVVIEFDFAVLNGAELLFDTTKGFLRKLDNIELDAALEASHLVGNAYQDGLARLFALAKTKKTAQKAARELQSAFQSAVAAAVPAAIGASFKNFVRALTDRGVGVVISTCADLEAVRPLFGAAVGPDVFLFKDESDCYGAVCWDGLRRACYEAGVRYASSVAIVGSGVGVKAALRARMRSLAVIRDHVAYQDFGGTDDVIPEISGKTARRVLQALQMD